VKPRFDTFVEFIEAGDKQIKFSHTVPPLTWVSSSLDGTYLR
jgi:hypothetical protein